MPALAHGILMYTGNAAQDAPAWPSSTPGPRTICGAALGARPREGCLSPRRTKRSAADMSGRNANSSLGRIDVWRPFWASSHLSPVPVAGRVSSRAASRLRTSPLALPVGMLPTRGLWVASPVALIVQPDTGPLLGRPCNYQRTHALGKDTSMRLCGGGQQVSAPRELPRE